MRSGLGSAEGFATGSSATSGAIAVTKGARGPVQIQCVPVPSPGFSAIVSRGYVTINH